MALPASFLHEIPLREMLAVESRAGVSSHESFAASTREWFFLPHSSSSLRRANLEPGTSHGAVPWSVWRATLLKRRCSWLGRRAITEVSEGHSTAGQIFQHGDELVALVTMLTGEFDKFLHLGHHHSSFRTPDDSNRSTPTHFNEALVAQHPQGAQHGVRIHTKFGGEIPCLWNTFARTGFAFGDRPSYLGGHLLVQQGGIAAIKRSEFERRLVGLA